MAFNPSEPRDPHSGKWTLEGIIRDIGALPQGGQGNRTSFKGIEVRRHQSGAYRVKINGEARHYSTHEDAGKAVHGQSHTSAGVRHDAVREAVVSGSVPKPGASQVALSPSDIAHPSDAQRKAYSDARSRGLSHSVAVGAAQVVGFREKSSRRKTKQMGSADNAATTAGLQREAAFRKLSASQSATSRAAVKGLGPAAIDRIKEQIAKIEDRQSHRSQSARLKGRGAPNSASDQKDREALLALYQRLRMLQANQ